MTEDEVLLRREQAKQKARVCLRLGIAPSEYDNLDQFEIEAFLEEAKRMENK